jgi:alpha-tubulin suppressor-like RCC1 family protein
MRKKGLLWFVFLLHFYLVGGCGNPDIDCKLKELRFIDGTCSQVNAKTEQVGPAGLSVRNGLLQIYLEWDALIGALSYNLYWGNSTGISRSSNKISFLTGDNYTHSNLSPGIYFYRISAVTAQGETALSQEVSSQSLRVTSISAGMTHVCAFLDNGTAKCWGRNQAGQVGVDNSTTPNDKIGDQPGEIEEISGFSLGSGVSEIASGGSHNCALLDNGSVLCWGLNSRGQLGLDHTNSIGDNSGEMALLSAVDLGAKAVAIGAGRLHSCALLDNGSIKCWGNNEFGQLGIGNKTSQGDSSGEMALLNSIDFGQRVVSIAVGEDHNCALLDNGSIKCWGRNDDGQLGMDDDEDIGDSPGELATLSGVKLSDNATAVYAGGNNSCLLLDNGSIKCWGANNSGQLGLGRTSFPDDKVGDNLGEMSALSAITLERPVNLLTLGRDHICALLDNGTTQCWGLNDDGQLGLGHSDKIGDNPGEMTTLGQVPIAVATDLSASYHHSCALLENSLIKCWGHNTYGQLGVGDIAPVGDAPGAIEALSGINLVSP